MATEKFSGAKISVKFENPNEIFVGGENLSGKILIDSKNPVKVTKLIVILKGETKIEWNEENGMQKFSDFKEDFHSELDLTKNLEDLISEDSQLFQGNCSIPFQFKLPENLPSSIESTFGSTRYICRVEILDVLHSPPYHPHHFYQRHQQEERIQIFEFPFIVQAKILVGHIPRLEKPMVQEELMEITGCFRSEGAILVRLSLPREEFVLGEILNALIYIENQTTKHTVHEIRIALIQDLHFFVENFRENEKNESKVMVQEKIGPIPSGSAEEIEVELQIPKEIPPTQNGKLVSIWYRVAMIGDEHITAKISIPVIIAIKDP